MSVACPESKATAGARLSLRYPYSHPSPAAPGSAGEPSSTSPVDAQTPLDARSALSSAFRAPCGVLATCSTPLNFVPIVRAEHGFCAPRHEMVNILLSKEDKLRCAQRLVERALSILSTAWKIVETSLVLVVSTPHGEAVVNPHDGLRFPYQSTADHMPLRQFVHEVLRRSCTNFVNLQTALCYLEAIAAQLPRFVREEAIFMLKRAEPGYTPQPEVPALPSPLLCPRRTFLGTIIVASKFLQDRSFSVRSWAKLTGLAAPEVSRCERVVCAALDYRLWVGKDADPAPTIPGLDMAPVIAKEVAYQPEPPRPAPQMLRKTHSNIALTSSTSSAAAVDVPMPCPAKQHPLPAFKTLAAAIDEPFMAPPTWSDASLVRLPPMLTHAHTDTQPQDALLVRLPPMLAHAPTDTQPSRSQSQDADPHNASSSSLTPGLSCARSSLADSVSSLDPNTPEDLNAGSQGREDNGH